LIGTLESKIVDVPAVKWFFENYRWINNLTVPIIISWLSTLFPSFMSWETVKRWQEIMCCMWLRPWETFSLRKQVFPRGDTKPLSTISCWKQTCGIFLYTSDPNNSLSQGSEDKKKPVCFQIIFSWMDFLSAGLIILFIYWFTGG
jgi:hypothetical protein